MGTPKERREEKLRGEKKSLGYVPGLSNSPNEEVVLVLVFGRDMRASFFLSLLDTYRRRCSHTRTDREFDRHMCCIESSSCLSLPKHIFNDTISMGWTIEAGKACRLCYLADCFSGDRFMQVVRFVSRDMGASYLFCGLYTQRWARTQEDRVVCTFSQVD